MPDPALGEFIFPDGTVAPYDRTKTLEYTLKRLESYLNKNRKGEKYNSERGADIITRSVVGGDVPEAQLATLKKKYGWVQPIDYGEDPGEAPKVGPQWAIDALLGVDETESIEKARKRFKPGPGQETKRAYLVYDADSKEYYRINPKGIDLGDIAGSTRSALEFMGDIAGDVTATAATRGMNVPTQMAARATGAGGLGALGRGIFDAFQNQLGGRVDPRSQREKVATLLGTAGVHGGGQLAGEGLLRGISGGGRGLLGRGVKGAERKEALKELENTFGQELGPPSALTAGPLATSNVHRGGAVFRAIEGVLIKSPLGNTKLGDKFLRMAKSFDDILRKNLGLTEETGLLPYKKGAISEELETAIRGKKINLVGKAREARQGGYYGAFKARSDAMFADLNTPTILNMDVPDARQMLRDWLSQNIYKKQGKQTIHNATIGSGIITDIETLLNQKGPIKYGQLEELRRLTGKLLGSAKAARGTQSISEELFDSLYKTFREAQNSVLGPGLRRDFEAANKFLYEHMKEWEDVLDTVSDATGSKDPFNVMRRLIKGGDSYRLGIAREAVANSDNPAAWKKFLQTYIFEMGRTPTLEDFNVLKFVREYKSQWTDETKDIMFKGLPELRKAIDEMVNVVSHRIPRYPETVNPLFAKEMLPIPILGAASGVTYQISENKNGWQNIGMGVLFGALAGVGTQYYTSKLLSDPGFVRWLTHGIEASGSKFLKNIDELTAVMASAEDPETKYAIGLYLEELPKTMEMYRVANERRKKQMDKLGIKIDPSELKIRGE